MKTKLPITTLSGAGLNIIMDPNEIYPDDPGQGQPVRVETIDERYSSSWNAAMYEGELLGSGDNVKRLNRQQMKWLEEKEAEVNKWMKDNKA